jgi:hypothetical protein
MKTPEQFLEDNGLKNVDHFNNENVILLIKLRDAEHRLETLENLKNDLSI